MNSRITAAAAALCFLFAVQADLSYELKDRAIVTMLGLDYEDSIYTATASIYDAKASAEGAGEDSFTISACAATAAQAIDELSACSERQLFHKHNGLLLLGKGMQPEQLGAAARDIMRLNKIRLNTSVVLCEGTAAELITANGAPDAAEFEAFFTKQLESVDINVPLYALAQNQGAGMLPLIGMRQSQLWFGGFCLWCGGNSFMAAEKDAVQAAALLTGRAKQIEAAGEEILINASLLLAERSSDGLQTAIYFRAQAPIEGIDALTAELREMYAVMERHDMLGLLWAEQRARCTHLYYAAARNGKDILIELS